MSRRTDAESLLADLLNAGAIPLLEHERLRIEAPPRALTAARREQLEGCLAELRVIVSSRYRSREECVARRPCRRMSQCADPRDGRPCKASPNCCLCGSPLSPGRKYLCEACTDEQEVRIAARQGNGGQQ
jgi:hypothetical protein